MTIAAGFTTRTPLNEAVMDMRISFGTMTPNLVVFFASPRYDLEELVKNMREDIGTDGIIGCTSAGEFVSGRMQQEGISGLAMDEEVVENLCVQVIENISAGPDALQATVKKCEDHFGLAVKDMSPDEYFGLLLSAGSPETAKQLADAAADLTGVPFLNGIAGGNEPSDAKVFAGDTVHADAAVLVLVKPKARFKLCSVAGFAAEGETLLSETRSILEETEKAIDTKGGIIAFHNSLPLPTDEDDDPVQAYVDQFMDAPAAGFATLIGPPPETALPASMLILEKPKRKSFLDDL